VRVTANAGGSRMKWLAIWSLWGLVLALVAPADARPSRPGGHAGSVIINGVRINGAVRRVFARHYGIRMASGMYWYDPISGAWGLRGSPTLGFTHPGLRLGGRLQANASGGNSGVFINGRQLDWREAQFVNQFVPLAPGRYRLDAFGNWGYEGGLPWCNLRQIALSASGRGRGPWSHRSPMLDSSVGGDGQGFMYYIDKDSSVIVGP
jgi:hypothetical protein